MERIICSAILRNGRKLTTNCPEIPSNKPPVLCKRHGYGIWLKKQEVK